ncbi:MAG: hypothetical protein M0R06_06290, partial [Sphaerochaeta sp.]|nr:hypothetical protein [Sphaerochaeta sp.]
KATEDDKRLAQYQKDLDAAIERLSATLAGTAEDDKMTTWGKEWNALKDKYGVPNDVLDADLNKERYYPKEEPEQENKDKTWWNPFD